MVYTCGPCAGQTRFAVGDPKPAYRKATSIVKKTAANIQESSNAPTSATVTASKNRKARKKGGLEAILAKSRAAQQTSTGFGLDLMDFMKKT